MEQRYCEMHVMDKCGAFCYPFRRFAKNYPVCGKPAVDWVNFGEWAGVQVNKRLYVCEEHNSDAVRELAEK